eukprot:scaffold659842_cov60-Prasinocladus_malaysianus.AAC.1
MPWRDAKPVQKPGVKDDSAEAALVLAGAYAILAGCFKPMLVCPLPQSSCASYPTRNCQQRGLSVTGQYLAMIFRLV